jgi:DNA repair exonuclease SbcCD nuclease subunit
MKIAILNDTHAGVKNGSDIFLDYSERFYNNTFFPYIKENNIKKILHLGDYFEHRKYVNFKVLKRNYEHFISKLEEYDITMDIIPGNHDVYYKNTNDINSLDEILSQYDRITIYSKPTDINYDGCHIMVLPWLCSENSEEFMELVNKSTSTILAGHLELDGFEMMQGVRATHGMDKKVFDKFDLVLSGHYHTKSTQGNIHYLGTQYQLTWADAADEKHFHVFDTDTRELTPIHNPDKIFYKLNYDENNPPKIDNRYKNCYIKAIILNKKDLYAFDQWYDKLNKVEPFEVRVIENFEEYLGENVDDDGVDTVDTSSLLNSYIDSTDTNLNKEILKKLMHELFVEAQDVSTI